MRQLSVVNEPKSKDFLADAKKPLVLLKTTFQLPDMWHVQGTLKDTDKILTCYGLSHEEAVAVTDRLSKSGLCSKIERVHTWKTSPRGKWLRSIYEV
jgi:hypothetical protein